MVTETMDSDANVIWGARVSPEMKGRVTVMTIITGVKSPWLLGKSESRKPSQMSSHMSKELGIDLIR